MIWLALVMSYYFNKHGIKDNYEMSPHYFIEMILERGALLSNSLFFKHLKSFFKLNKKFLLKKMIPFIQFFLPFMP